MKLNASEFLHYNKNKEEKTMKKIFVSIMVLIVALFTACGRTSVTVKVDESSTTTEVAKEIQTMESSTSTTTEGTEEIRVITPSDLVVPENVNKWADMSWDEVYDSFSEVTPSLEFSSTKEYTALKCIKNVNFEIEKTQWDIYVFFYDWIIGTLIVNESGQTLELYGCVLHHVNENFNVCISDVSENWGVYVHPEGKESESYGLLLGTVNY